MFAVKSKFLVTSSDNLFIDSGFIFENGIILKILPNIQIDELAKEDPQYSILDFSDKIIAPGFINAHIHQYGMLSHGIPSSVENFESFLEDYWWPLVENRIGTEEVRCTTAASAAEMLKSGVTGFCDTLEAPFSGKGILREQAKLIEKIGMRALLSIESCERIDRANGNDCLEENAEFIKWARENTSKIQGLVCTHTTFTCSENFLRRAKSLSEELKCIWQFHLSESVFEPAYCREQFGMAPVEYLNRLGLLDETVLASQCVQLDENERGILKSRGVKAIHMPLSNCEVGGGIAPVPEMLELGMEPALGSDGYINDFFEVMRGAFLIHKANKLNPQAMPSRSVFRMATEYGARALGWDKAGVIQEGNWADFIVMEDAFPTPVTVSNIYDQIVVFGRKEYINSVFVDGKALVSEGRLLTIDENQASIDMRNCAAAFWEEIR